MPLCESMHSRIVRGVFVGLALASTFTIRSSSTSTTSSSLADSNTYSDCNGIIDLVKDGYCDAKNNNLECDYDGGDCCECNCVDTGFYTCGHAGFDCLNSTASDPVMECERRSTEPPETSPCTSITRMQRVVNSTDDAYLLAQDLNCSGGIFDVEWNGNVSVNMTLYVIDGTILNVTGRSNAVVDGGGITQLFSTFNGSLSVTNMQLRNGAGIQGGAIFAGQESEVVLMGVDFSSNRANYSGGAIHVENACLQLAGSSTFTSNIAIRGGAISIVNSSFVSHGGNGEQHTFLKNNATYGGALYVHGGSTVDSVAQQHPASTSSLDIIDSGNGVNRRLYTGEFNNTPTAASSSTFYPTFAETIFTNNIAKTLGGAVYVDDHSQVLWVGNTTFEGNSAESGGALFFGSASSVKLQGTTVFTHNIADVDGGAIASTVYDSFTGYSSLYLNDTVRFERNTCRGNGGAMALFGDLTLESGDIGFEFMGNSAGVFGGAIFMSDATYGHRFDNARFMDNTAQNGGAVFALRCGTSTSGVGIYPTHFHNCTFHNNSAIVAGGAIETAVGHDKIVDTLFSSNIAVEGGALRLRGTSELYNSSFLNNESDEESGPAISNGGSISEMTGLTFSENRFRCSTSQFLNFTLSKGNDIHDAICEGCHGVECKRCMVQDNTSVPICTTTFAHARSGGGATTIQEVTVDAGYWRATKESTEVLTCYNVDACVGGITGDLGYCAKGYEGPYCSVCSDKYGATLAYTCSECSAWSLVLAAVALTSILLAVVAVVRHMVYAQQGTTTRGIAVRLLMVLPLQSLKSIIVAWQIVTQFRSVANVVYPDVYRHLLDFAALVNFDVGRMLSAGCIIDVDFHHGLLAATVAPLAVITLLGMTYAVAVRRNIGSERALQAIRRKHQSAVIVVTFFVYSSVSSAVFRTFACDELDDGNVYLRADYRIECDSSKHHAFQIYAGFMILVYPVGIPVLYALILFHEHKMMTKGSGYEAHPRHEPTSNLRKPYRRSVFYYEVVECCRRVLLTGAVVFIYPNTAAQISVTIVIAFTFFLVSESLRPYVSRWDSWVSRTGHVIVFLSMYVALLLKVDVSGERARDQNMFAGFLVAAHTVAIVAVIAETIALVFSLRTQETSLPSSRSFRARSFRISVDSSTEVQSAL